MTTSDRPREKCGVFAISGTPAAAELAFMGLYALQHRGQESAGIVAIDELGTARSHRGMGLVADVFDESRLAGLVGSTAIGHVRYSTSGGSELRNCQPVLVEYRHGSMALAHNGNITNGRELRHRLSEEGAIFQTDSDSEVVIHLIARSRREEERQQVDDALSQLVGAFSLVLSVGKTLYAARDPRGFRPLVLGRLGEAIVVSSETCGQEGVRPAAGARASRRSRLRLRRAGFIQLSRARLFRGVGNRVRARADSEPLRGADVHLPDAGRPRLPGSHQVQRGDRADRGQAGRRRGRLSGSRHDEQGPGGDAPGGGSA
ncbi:MAG: class II glutamine amidotransferase [Gemmatimonadales bacterium]